MTCAPPPACAMAEGADAQAGAQAKKGPRKGKADMCDLLMALQGSTVIVELVHDVVLKGMLREADKSWNLMLDDATASYPCHPTRPRRALESVFVRGNNIRYVHFPDAVEPNAAVQAHKTRLRQIRRGAV